MEQNTVEGKIGSFTGRVLYEEGRKYGKLKTGVHIILKMEDGVGIGGKIRNRNDQKLTSNKNHPHQLWGIWINDEYNIMYNVQNTWPPRGSLTSTE